MTHTDEATSPIDGGADQTSKNQDPQSSESASYEEQLETLRDEKATLEAQYGALLGKLTTMRNTLGDKLRQDADELDRREQQIGQLQAQNEDLLQTTETLKSELISSNEDNDHLQRELDQLRSRMMDSQRSMENESSQREELYREAREEIENLRDELEEKKRDLMNETVKREELEANLKDIQTAMSNAIRDIELLKEDRDHQAESASNLQSVLEEFQSVKESEIQSLVADTQSRLNITEKELKQYKERCAMAEAKLATSESNSQSSEMMKKEIKEKSLLIGKLRHEAVILNEHLTEALRRLRKDTNEHSVDRRLVTNVLLSFILTPREDTKRFEMLSLLASILSWDDEQREQVGLQKSGSSASKAARNSISSSSPELLRKTLSRGTPKLDPDTLGDGDTITDQWVSFLLREANSASPTINKSFSSLSLTSPTSTTIPPNRKACSEAPNPPSSPGSSLSTLSVLTRPPSDSP